MEAKEALQSAADLFIGICHAYGILGEVLKKRGFELAQEHRGGSPDSDFVSVEMRSAAIQTGYDDVFPLEVPLDLVAATKQEKIKCLH